MSIRIMRIRDKDVEDLLAPEEGEKIVRDLTFRLSKEIYKAFIKEDAKMGNFILDTGAVKYMGKVDKFDCEAGEYITIRGRIEYASPIDPEKEKADALDRIAKASQFGYKKIIYSDGVTTILWGDGTKTTVRAAKGEEPNPEAGIAYAFMKKALGNKNRHNKVLRKEVPAVLAAETRRRIEKDRKRMDKDLKKYEKEKTNGETENS